jgi:hypothetical protein
MRMRAWGIAISSGHLLLALAGWLVLGVPPWFFGGCALLTLVVTQAAAPLMDPRGEDGGDGGDGPDAPDDPDPPWWPEFEREFRAHTERARDLTVR